MPRALIVDDHDVNLAYLDTLLRARGYVVDVAHHGEEALARARAHAPDVVVSDLLMPVMDGYSLLRTWKLEESLHDVPFVVYTATYTDPADEQLALDLGADLFLVKPLAPDAFLDALDEAMARPARPGDASNDHTKKTLIEYNQALVRKLEAKSRELTSANLALTLDVAERTKAVEASRESEERFRQIAETIDDVFVLGDLSTNRVLYVNPAFERIFGIPRTSLENDHRAWRDVVHPVDRAHTYAALNAHPTGGFDGTFRLKRTDGTERVVRARTFGVRNDDGAVYRLVVLVRDITEIRALTDQLRHAQKMEAVGRMAGGLAHDFNNVLSVILSYANLIHDALPEESPLRSDIDEVRRAGERAARLTAQLLAFSRKQVLNPRVIELGETVRSMRNLIERIVGEHISVSIVTSEAPLRVFVDPTQIEQIVMNLAANARDAMGASGTLSIVVDVFDVDDASESVPVGVTPGHHARLTVRDTGSGMDAATRERIFEPFFTTKPQGKGTGLGLSTVFGIVSQSGGRIDVESEPGAGASFIISLPITEAAEERPLVRATRPASLRGDECVLLVEDDDPLREVAAAILRRSGYEVVDARNAGEAIVLFEQRGQEIDLLLTDVVMPHMNGRELAARLLASRPDLDVILMSGYAANAILEHGVLEDGVAYVQKPFTPTELLTRVRDVLNARISRHPS